MVFRSASLTPDRLPDAQRGRSATVMVVHGARSVRVDLRRLGKAKVGASTVVCLADLWVASGLAGDLFELAFDFVGDDGSRASSGAGPGAQLLGTSLTKGHIDLARRNLIWDESLSLPESYTVRGVATIYAEDVDGLAAGAAAAAS